MFLRKVLLSLVSVGIFFTVVGYTQSASLTSQKIRICNNEQCLKTSELIDVDKYKNENIIITPNVEETYVEKKEEDNLVEYLTLVMTGVIPTFGFIWWVLTSQQEKKIIEFSQMQDAKFQELIKEVLDKQEENTKTFGSELKELIKKIDDITRNFQDDRLEYVKKLSEQNEKFASLNAQISRVEELAKKVADIEGFLNKHFDEYHIRK